jgi:hypothetical protein
MAIATNFKAKAVGAKVNSGKQGSIFHGYEKGFM